MDSLGNAASDADATTAEKENYFRKLLRQRLTGSEDYFVNHRVLGRYYVAAMLFSAVTIYVFSFVNIQFGVLDSIHDHSAPLYPALQNSTTQRIAILYGSLSMELCFQIPGALLIYTISSHKFLTLSMAISSIIHMLTPLAMDYSSLFVAILAQKLVMAPIRIAVLSMWKDWAPPHERKKFVILSLSSWILFIPSAGIIRMLHNIYETEANFYVLGVCGLAWSFLWFFTVTDTPAKESQVVQNNQIYQQNNKLSIFKEMPKLSEVPWKSIFTSVPVFSLCLLYLKMGISVMLIISMAEFFPPTPEEYPSIESVFYNQVLFSSLYTVVFFISAAITDFLTRKYSEMIKTRKRLLCGALIIHAILLLGSLAHNSPVIVTFCWLSNIVLSTSITGIFTNALELSSKYVSIIGGFIETSYLLGVISCLGVLEHIDYILKDWQLINTKGIILSYEIGFTIIVVVVFYIWGSLEEQPWSLNHSSGEENASPQSHPVQDEHELKGAVPQNT